MAKLSSHTPIRDIIYIPSQGYVSSTKDFGFARKKLIFGTVCLQSDQRHGLRYEHERFQTNAYLNFRLSEISGD